MKKLITVVRMLAALGLAAAVSGANAQDDDAWRFGGTLYLWGPSISAKTVFPPPVNGVSVGLEASDYLSALEFAFMGSLEARKGKYGLLADFIYLSFGADRSNSRDLTLSGPGGIIQIPADASADVKLDLKGYAWNLAGTYEFIRTPTYELHGLAGLRYLKLDTQVDWRFNGNVGGLPPVARAGSASTDPRVWDGIIGVRGRAKLGDGQWYAPYYVDLGTGQSDFTWQAFAGVGYSFGWGDLSLIYRHLTYEFSDIPAKNLTFSGPALAATFRW